jgi:hypothetical protein
MYLTAEDTNKEDIRQSQGNIELVVKD